MRKASRTDRTRWYYYYYYPVRESRAFAAALTRAVLRLSHREHNAHRPDLALRRRSCRQQRLQCVIVILFRSRLPASSTTRVRSQARVSTIGRPSVFCSFFCPSIFILHTHRARDTCVCVCVYCKITAIVRSAIIVLCTYGTVTQCGRGRDEKEKIEKKKQLRAPRRDRRSVIAPPSCR